jgi:hypothetical protein
VTTTPPPSTPREPGAYFGEPWPSGVCDTGTRVPAPVGEPCASCEEAVVEGDRGSFVGNGVWPGRPALVPVHRECALRDVAGGIGHHEDHRKWCLEVGDPDGGRTRRQSSREVWELLTGRPA